MVRPICFHRVVDTRCTCVRINWYLCITQIALQSLQTFAVKWRPTNLCLWLSQHNGRHIISNISRRVYFARNWRWIFFIVLSLYIHWPDTRDMHEDWEYTIYVHITYIKRYERNCEESARTWIDDGRDENLRGSTNWIRERLLQVLRDVCIYICIYANAYTRLRRSLAHFNAHIGAYATRRAGHGGIFTCSNSTQAVKLAVSLCLHYYVNHNVRQ